MSVQDIFNYRQVDEQIGTAGQPTEAQLLAVAQDDRRGAHGVLRRLQIEHVVGRGFEIGQPLGVG